MAALPVHCVTFSLTAQDVVFTAVLRRDREGLASVSPAGQFFTLSLEFLASPIFAPFKFQGPGASSRPSH